MPTYIFRIFIVLVNRISESVNRKYFFKRGSGWKFLMLDTSCLNIIKYLKFTKILGWPEAHACFTIDLTIFGPFQALNIYFMYVDMCYTYDIHWLSYKRTTLSSGLFRAEMYILGKIWCTLCI